jgi:hypothetical protein
MIATTGACGNARAISAVMRSAPPYVSMKSCATTTLSCAGSTLLNWTRRSSR